MRILRYAIRNTFDKNKRKTIVNFHDFITFSTPRKRILFAVFPILFTLATLTTSKSCASLTYLKTLAREQRKVGV